MIRERPRRGGHKHQRLHGRSGVPGHHYGSRASEFLSDPGVGLDPEPTCASTSTLRRAGRRLAHTTLSRDEVPAIEIRGRVGDRLLPPLLILLFVRLLRWRSDHPESIERLLIWIYLLNAPVAAVFVTRVRYRVPFDELLIIIAASTLVSLLVTRRQDRTPEVAAVGRTGGQLGAQHHVRPR